MDKVCVSFRAIDEDWDKEILDYNLDIYHLSKWIKASTFIDEGTPQGIVAKYKHKKMFFPILIRHIDDEYWDATSTYGYGGPVIDNDLTDNEINMMLEEIKLFLFKEGCVSLFMRLHPILNKELIPTVGTVITHGLTLMSDLTKSEDEHWKETQNQHRRGIKKALKMNVTTKIEPLTEERALVFSNIYKETMENLEASQYYFFNDSYFYALSKNLRERLLLITAYKDDQAIASTICTVCKESGIMQFHLGGTLNYYKNLQPSKLITHVARDWGRQNNYKILHLGGGVGAKLDSLYEYKKGFSSQELLFKTYRLITNAKEYSKLVSNIGLNEDDLDSDFFPLYRKKVHKEEAI